MLSRCFHATCSSDVSHRTRIIEVGSDRVTFGFDDWEIPVSRYHPSFIHDFTISSNMERTDQFIDGVTPDVVNNDSIIEYTTSIATSEGLMISKLMTKVAKYDEIAKRHDKTLKVIVVSSDKIVCNFEDYSEEDFNGHITRYNVAMNIKKKVYDEYQLDLWGDEGEMRFERILKSVLLSHVPVTPKDDFERSLDVDLPEVNGETMTYFLKEVVDTMLNFKTISGNKTESYKVEGTRLDYKRCVPVSLLVPESYDSRLSHRTELMKVNPTPEEIKSNGQLELINIAQTSVMIKHDKNHELRIATEEEEVPNKRTKSMYHFHHALHNDKRTEMALSGVQAKKMMKSKDPNVINKRKKDKESFNWNAPTDDIEEFINSNFLMEFPHYVCRDISVEMYNNWSAYLRTFKESYRKNASLNEKIIQNEYEKNARTILIQYTKFIQALFTEINLSVRENLSEDFFVVKPIPGYNCDVYIKCVGSYKPVFFFIVSKTAYKFPSKTVGVKYDSYGPDQFDVSEWSSVKIRDIENYLSINSAVMSSLAYLSQIYKSTSVISQHINFILLILLSNKDRDEEIITLLRYIYMRSLSITDNVTTLTSKLPSIIRSRLNLFQVKRTMNIMNLLHENKPQVKLIDGDRDVVGLIDLFGNTINFKQALNLCYYGYVVNKAKQSEANQSSKLIDKILEYDVLVNDGNSLSGVDKDNLSDHFHDNKFLAVITTLAEQRVKQVYGDNYHKHLEDDFCRYMSRQNVISLATIKASAKSDLPEKLEGDTLKKLRTRRPKVTESLKKIMDAYGDFEHPVELVNYCISEVDKNDSFNVELFSKDQHAGIREIYIVDSKVRIIQWFLESLSRSLCKLFSSETMTNPNMKDFISQRIVRDAMLKQEDPIMLCRSGDASKWSQTQNVTKFYQVLKRFLPERYHKIIKSILMLWFRKKIYLPADLIDICMKTDLSIENTTINFIRSVYSGSIQDDRLKMNQPYLRIRTGFMQGILHFTSSFFHTIVQEGFLVLKKLIVKKLFPEVKANNELFTNVILQGSDDNSETIVIPKKIYKKGKKFFRILVQLKDLMSHYVGIKVSKEKTASCVPFLMEYNSTWELAGKFVMPTIKFVFVSNDIPHKQTLIGRQEFYYSLLTNCLEKGCTLKTCALIRLSQAEQHYKQLGYLHNILFDDYIELIKVNKSPALGYFMFEPTVVCGLLGFDFMLYFHSIETEYTKYIEQEEKEIPTQILSNMGYKSVADYTVSKYSFKKYDEIIKNLNLGDVNSSREKINAKPEVLYMTINDKNIEMDLLNLKMHDFSVKESISSRFSKSEMFSSLVYILSRPVCYFNKEKHSLIKLCLDLNKKPKMNVMERTAIKKSFTRSKQYDNIIDEIRPIINSNILVDQTYIQRGSSKIKLLEGINDESYKLLDLCKSKWFNIHSLPINNEVLDRYFEMAKTHIPWLKDTEEETRESLNCDSFQLYYYLLNSFKDAKYIKLLDTPGKRGNLMYLMSRIAVEDKKMHHVSGVKENDDSSFNTIRSNLKFIIEYPYSQDYKKWLLKDLINIYLKCDLRVNEKQVAQMVKHLLDDNFHLFQTSLMNNTNNLNLVIFTKPQTFNEDSGKWTDHGVLLGKSGNLIYELHVKDDFVIKIAVNNMDVARNKFFIILKTAKELKFKLKGLGEETNRINESGIMMDKYGTEVIELKELSFNLANLKNMEVIVEHGRIKIITRISSDKLTKATLLNNLDAIDAVKVLGRDGTHEWIEESKRKKGQAILGSARIKEQRATRTITLCSIKAHSFTFNSLDKALFNIDDFAKLFWEQEQSSDVFMIKFNELLEKKKIRNYDMFINEFRLDEKFANIFEKLLLGETTTRDELINNVEIDEDENISQEFDFSSIFDKVACFADMESVINNALTDRLLNMIEGIEDDISSFIDNKEGEIFLEMEGNFGLHYKEFYIQYSENSVLDSKLFSTLNIKLKTILGSIKDYLSSDGKDLNEVSSYVKNILVCLLNSKANNNYVSIGNIPQEKILTEKELLNTPLIKLTTDMKTLDEISKKDDNFLRRYVDLNFKTDDDTLLMEEVYEESENDVKESFKRVQGYNAKPMIARAKVRYDEFCLKHEIIKRLMKASKMKKADDEKRKEDAYDKAMQEIEVNRIRLHQTREQLKDIALELLDLMIDLEENSFFYSEANLKEHSVDLPDASNLIVINSKPDGGCLFYSLMNALMTKDQDMVIHLKDILRSAIVKTIKKFIQLPILKFSEGDDYPDRLENLSVWGDIYCITAFGLMTDSIIYLMENGKWVGCFGCNRENKKHILHLQRINKDHFEALIDKRDFNKFEDYYNEILENMGEFQY